MNTQEGNNKSSSSNWLEVPFRAIPKPRMTRADIWQRRKIVNDYWAFKDKLVYLAREKKFKLADKYCITFIFEIPQSWSKKKKLEMNLGPHRIRPDLDNLIKAINDCLRSKEDDDSKVSLIYAKKEWGAKDRFYIENV